MPKLLKHILRILGLAVVVGVLSPIYDMVNVIEVYRDPSHWVVCFVGTPTVYLIATYFLEINPRTFYHCCDIVVSSAALILSTFAFIGGCIFALTREGIVIKILLFAAVLLLYLFGIYAFFHRGVAVYKKGKIRIFKFRITTYHTDSVDDVRLDYNGRKCNIHILVAGQDHVFRVYASSAKVYESRLQELLPLEK